MSQTAKDLQSEKLLYTSHVHTQGGRDHGIARSNDGQLEVKFSPPGSGRPGTNPEQMLAAGWSACFEGALDIVARKRRITVAEDPTIDAEVDLNYGADGFFLRARLNVSLPGIERHTAQTIIDEAHKICPYSKALSRSIDVTVSLI
ncbi:organic hydroperoxide resistance protein [Mesorhizobium sp. B2-8-9]|uniref:organic hydroperoxide resistance protein n=1 Tax=Mesorhizobium sp. B2-8-9 TaxID=2589899 RepID=UPI00112CABF7|nr:organic hydroperoxide resistance protein [Mesorhizobium sp. B2-8-9]TPI76269.1 organic hydroperoxide resistance protein [Mesorhizobium sp. B2-8-9]